MHVHVPLQGFNRRSNTGSLTAQAPPTVVHNSSTSFVSTPPSSSTELTTAEHSVNRRGNTDPLAAQAPPTVVHSVHSHSLGKLMVKQVTQKRGRAWGRGYQLNTVLKCWEWTWR